MNYRIYLSTLALLVLIISCKSTQPPEVLQVPGHGEWRSDYVYSGMDEPSIRAHIAVERYILDLNFGRIPGSPPKSPLVRIDRVFANPFTQSIRVDFNIRYSEFPIRPATVAAADSVIRHYLPDSMKDFELEMFSMGKSLHELIPNYYLRGTSAQHTDRLPTTDPTSNFQWIRNLDQPWQSPSGLENRHIALWHSHGWYYKNDQDRWKWQRPRLFESVEDLLPMSFVLPYIVPMLENAGAYVWIPRERDIQHQMVIVDNDPAHLKGYSETTSKPQLAWKQGSGKGFQLERGHLKGNENPFSMGTYRFTKTDTTVSASVRWTPEIPEAGTYAVYISYVSTDSSTSDAHYRVYHRGGETNFLVNQRVGGSTWIYLGHFEFEKGSNPGSGAVQLTNRSSNAGDFISADAVRFGGGVGLVERGGRTSGRPRYLEAARYNLQYLGVPDTLVWHLNTNNDYNDDFQSRGEWVNYLRGGPYGPNKDRSQGLGIPVDLSLAFHTDAGVTRDDRIFGTLAIYSLPDSEDADVFPDSVSRMANRDLTDLMQTQIVRDVRAKYDTTWVRRRLQNSRYSEAMRPNVPSVLLELLSHQNFRDMEFGKDPRFRFDVSRAIYKSMVRFLATQYDFDYVIQPLPVSHMMASFEGDGVRLSWKAEKDELEPTADPEYYVIYVRRGEGGFDNGRVVTDTTFFFQNPEPGEIYSFKVRAGNRGGVSFPSEVISVSRPRNSSRPVVLLINGFTRISGPAVIKEGNYRGFATFSDAGVPDGYDVDFTGTQVNFDNMADWVANDNPGHGASYGNMETSVIPGNTFDFGIIHGRSIVNAGYGFISVSEKAIESGLVNPTQYRLVNLILGNQRQVGNQSAYADSLYGPQFGIYGPGMRRFLKSIADNRGGIFVSGAHVGTDLSSRPLPDPEVLEFASGVLRYTPVTNHASLSGDVFRTGLLFQTERLTFNTRVNSGIYRVDAPDAIHPAGRQARTVLRYHENEFSAAVGFQGSYKVLVFGFPFETILTRESRDTVMRDILNYIDP